VVLVPTGRCPVGVLSGRDPAGSPRAAVPAAVRRRAGSGSRGRQGAGAGAGGAGAAGEGASSPAAAPHQETLPFSNFFAIGSERCSQTVSPFFTSETHIRTT
jgi:hypothetical protein